VHAIHASNKKIKVISFQEVSNVCLRTVTLVSCGFLASRRVYCVNEFRVACSQSNYLLDERFVSLCCGFCDTLELFAFLTGSFGCYTFLQYNTLLRIIVYMSRACDRSYLSVRANEIFFLRIFFLWLRVLNRPNHEFPC